MPAAVPDAARDDPVPGGAGSIARHVSQARLRPADDEVPVLETRWLSVLADGSERPVARVAALSQAAQTALRRGEVSECLAALTQQRAAAADDPVARVWALTASSVCRCVFGQLSQARADLAEARQACHYAAPLLAEPFWRFTEAVCHWLGGNWPAAQADAAALDANQVSAFPAALGGTVIALRVELLRGLGLRRESRQLAGRLAAAGPAEMSAWAQAGLDIDENRPAEAMRRLLVENARRKGRARHGGGLRRVELDSGCSLAEPPPDDDLLALDEALDRLAALDPTRAEVVKLRFFAGLTMPEVAGAMGVSLATAERYWTFARTWLFAELNGEPPSDSLPKKPSPT